MVARLFPSTWYLEGFVDDSQKLWRTAVRSLPFHVGRQSKTGLSLHSKLVSHRHAELFEREESLWIRDLGSTNGTFVNGEPVTSECILGEGDIIHFANLEFRVALERQELSGVGVGKTQTLNFQAANLSGGGIGRYRELRDMLRQRTIRALFQPLVRLADGAVLGYEGLGRGELDGIETSPLELFWIAESIDLEVDLSAAFRIRCLEEAHNLPATPKVFVNTHPSEVANVQALLESMRHARGLHPDLDIVLEIHESAVTSLDALRELRNKLEELGIAVAFDDFGKGQARLLELTDVAPNFLKFDAVFIKNVHEASRQRREMVKTLVQLALDMEITTVAEGVECSEEAQACIDLGFQYAQGFHFSRPAPAPSFSGR
ncbi:MAG: EAL domain-containing protein [bacterium]|nr:EAL domain-containing protein [bacterium]